MQTQCLLYLKMKVKPICITPTFRDFTWGFHRIFTMLFLSSAPSHRVIYFWLISSVLLRLVFIAAPLNSVFLMLIQFLTLWTPSPMFSSSFLGGYFTVLSLGSWLLLSFGTFLYFSSLLFFPLDSIAVIPQLELIESFLRFISFSMELWKLQL